MMPHTRAGQTESSFQWIFVLVAGIALLLLLLGFARSCTQTGETSLRQGDAQAAASRLASVAWDGNARQDLSLPDAAVDCRAGTISLEMEDASATLDRAPTYLPPTLGGDAQAVTRSIALGDGTPAPFPLGGVAFVLDERTVYLLVDDSAGVGSRMWDTLPQSDQLVRITVADLERPIVLAEAVPGSPRTIIIAYVSSTAILSNVDTTRFAAGTDVRGVALQPKNQHGGVATFYTSDGTHLVLGGAVPYAHETMGVGMVIAGDREVAWCATAAFAMRARTLVRIAADRAESLSTRVLDPACATTLTEASVMLDAMAQQPSDAGFLDRLFASERDILTIQNVLLSRPGSCPGVA